MKRRDFLKYIGAGGVGVVLGGIFGKKSTPPGAKLIPYLVPPEDIIPGVGAWYSSLCTQCDAGCGVVIKVMEGRAKKVEGNPLHPVSRGKLCARGQAAVQALYNPDRIKGPLKRRGKRGEGSFEPISWKEAMNALTENLKKLSGEGKAKRMHLVTGANNGHLHALITDFMKAYGSPNYYQDALFGYRNLRLANKASLGINTIPYYDIENTKYLLSFGADFASTWLSPVNYSYGYGQMRQGDPKRRGHIVQVEPRMSLTGANADEWIPVKPGAEGVLALSIAYAIVDKGYYKGADSAKWRTALAGFSPEKTASVTDVEKGRVYKMARSFALTRPSLAIGGEGISSYENGVSGLVAVNVLNHLAGNLGRKGGVIPNPDGFSALRGTGPLDLKKGIKILIDKASAGGVDTLIVQGTNPLFTTPRASGLRGAMEKIPFIVSISSFMDETSDMADIILPMHTSLEDWGDDIASPGVGRAVATLMQPVVSPYYDSRGAGDIFIDLTGRLGLGKAVGLGDATDFHLYLKAAWKNFYKTDKLASASSPTSEGFWNNLLQYGGWWPSEGKTGGRLGLISAKARGLLPEGPASFKGDLKKYPFYLLPYAQPAYLDGRGANLPWLQELPDPVSNVVWGSWVEINPATAKKLSIREGDLVAVESPYGKIKAPAYLYPGIRPDTIAVPIGQGHSVYGKYAGGRGANPLEILPAQWDADSGARGLNVTRVSIKKTSGISKFVKVGASSNEYGREIVETISPGEYAKLQKENI